ncbi:hypothetical protein [Streptomyces venezuelae]|uniref:hypothetical protein n=1 Tax=Streptomyces venezuelae TaxID=54571 RepID=UPI00378B6371
MNHEKHQNHEITASRNPLWRSAALALTAALGVTVLAACGGGSGSGGNSASKSDAAHTGTDAPRVLWMGDSIAGAEAPALGAALKAGAVPFKSMAADGGGGVVGAVAEPTWDQLPKEIESFAPDVVAYQITTYDWGTPDEQRAAYEKLAKTVGDAGADLDIRFHENLGRSPAPWTVRCDADGNVHPRTEDAPR